MTLDGFVVWTCYRCMRSGFGEMPRVHLMAQCDDGHGFTGGGGI